MQHGAHPVGDDPLLTVLDRVEEHPQRGLGGATAPAPTARPRTAPPRSAAPSCRAPRCPARRPGTSRRSREVTMCAAPAGRAGRLCSACSTTASLRSMAAKRAAWSVANQRSTADGQGDHLLAVQLHGTADPHGAGRHGEALRGHRLDQAAVAAHEARWRWAGPPKYLPPKITRSPAAAHPAHEVQGVDVRGGVDDHRHAVAPGRWRAPPPAGRSRPGRASPGRGRSGRPEAARGTRSPRCRR